jgi:hypothetical protein
MAADIIKRVKAVPAHTADMKQALRVFGLAFLPAAALAPGFTFGAVIFTFGAVIFNGKAQATDAALRVTIVREIRSPTDTLTTT